MGQMHGYKSKQNIKLKVLGAVIKTERRYTCDLYTITINSTKQIDIFSRTNSGRTMWRLIKRNTVIKCDRMRWQNERERDKGTNE